MFITFVDGLTTSLIICQLSSSSDCSNFINKQLVQTARLCIVCITNLQVESQSKFPMHTVQHFKHILRQLKQKKRELTGNSL